MLYPKKKQILRLRRRMTILCGDSVSELLAERTYRRYGAGLGSGFFVAIAFGFQKSGSALIQESGT